MGRFSLLLGVALLGGCASGGFFGKGRDWTAFAADIYAMPVDDRESLAAATAREHADSGEPDAAIRLAILTATPDASEQDLGAALELLDEAEAALRGEPDSRDFIAFFRPIVMALQAQSAALATESLTRQSLEAQLEELKALEESLNDGAANR
jgi:hypothetical protein